MILIKVFEECRQPFDLNKSFEERRQLNKRFEERRQLSKRFEEWRKSFQSFVSG